MDELLDAAHRAARYLADLPARSVAPSREAISALETIDRDLSSSGRSTSSVIDELDAVGSPATTASAGGRYFGFVTGGTHPAGLAASVLAGAWDQNSALAIMSPAAAAFDAVALRWIRELLGLPSSAEGVFVTGASMANATAIAAGRDAVLAAAGWNVRDDGLRGAPPLSVIVGAEVHSTVLKVLRFLGVGGSDIRVIEADAQGRMRSDALPTLTGPALVLTQAGNVNSGAFDPIGEIVEWASVTGAWVHVDGAFGLWAAASPETHHLVEGVEHADSWATDCHKWLNTPYDSAVAVVSDPRHLHQTFGLDAPYLPTGLERNAATLGPNLSQRARGVEAWAVLSALGTDGVADLVARTCAHARTMATALERAGHRVLNDVVLNQVVVTFGDATEAVIAAVQEDGTCWCGGTMWQGRPAMRISVSSWATTTDDIARSIGVICDLAATTLARYE